MIYGHLKVSASQTELIIHSSSSFSFPALFNVIVAHLDTEVRNLSHLQLRRFSSITPGESSSIMVKWFSTSFLSLSSLLSTHCHCQVQIFNIFNFSSCSHSLTIVYVFIFPKRASVSFIFGFLGLSWEPVLLQECSQVVILSSCASFSPSLLSAVSKAYSV